MVITIERWTQRFAFARRPNVLANQGLATRPDELAHVPFRQDLRKASLGILDEFLDDTFFGPVSHRACRRGRNVQ